MKHDFTSILWEGLVNVPLTTSYNCVKLPWNELLEYLQLHDLVFQSQQSRLRPTMIEDLNEWQGKMRFAKFIDFKQEEDPCWKWYSFLTSLPMTSLPTRTFSPTKIISIAITDDLFAYQTSSTFQATSRKIKLDATIKATSCCFGLFKGYRSGLQHSYCAKGCTCGRVFSCILPCMGQWTWLVCRQLSHALPQLEITI